MKVNKWIFWLILLVYSILSTLFFAYTTSGGGDWAALGMFASFSITYVIILITILFINIITRFFKNDIDLTISKTFLMFLIVFQGTALITNFTNIGSFGELVDKYQYIYSEPLLKLYRYIIEEPNLILSTRGFWSTFWAICTVILLILFFIYIVSYIIGVIFLVIKIIKKDIKLTRLNIFLILLIVVQFAALFINLMYCDSIRNNSITCRNDSGLQIAFLLSICIYAVAFIVFIIHSYDGIFFSIVFRNSKFQSIILRNIKLQALITILIISSIINIPFILVDILDVGIYLGYYMGLIIITIPVLLLTKVNSESKYNLLSYLFKIRWLLLYYILFWIPVIYYVWWL